MMTSVPFVIVVLKSSKSNKNNTITLLNHFNQNMSFIVSSVLMWCLRNALWDIIWFSVKSLHRILKYNGFKDNLISAFVGYRNKAVLPASEDVWLSCVWFPSLILSSLLFFLEVSTLIIYHLKTICWNCKRVSLWIIFMYVKHIYFTIVLRKWQKFGYNWLEVILNTI